MARNVTALSVSPSSGHWPEGPVSDVSGFYSPNFPWIGFILQEARAREEGLENLGDIFH
jgi:hypothetical protein